MAKYLSRSSSDDDTYNPGMDVAKAVGFYIDASAKEDAAAVARQEASRKQDDYDRTVDVVRSVNAAKLAGDFGPATAMASKWIGVNGQFVPGEDGSVTFNVAGRPDESGNVSYTPGMKFNNIDQFQEYAIRNYADPAALVKLQQSLALDRGQRINQAELSPESRVDNGQLVTGVRTFEGGQLTGFKGVPGVGASPQERSMFFQGNENETQAKYAEQKELASIAAQRASAGASAASAQNSRMSMEEKQAEKEASYVMLPDGTPMALRKGETIPEGATNLGAGALGKFNLTTNVNKVQTQRAREEEAVMKEMDKRQSSIGTAIRDIDTEFKDVVDDPFINVTKAQRLFDRTSVMLPKDVRETLMQDWDEVGKMKEQLAALGAQIPKTRDAKQKEALTQQYRSGVANLSAAAARLRDVASEAALTPRRPAGVPGR